MALQKTSCQVDGVRVQCYKGDMGFPILVLHGSGPGASVIGNFAAILPALAERYQVLASDLIGFGRSDRKPSQPYFDPDLWLKQAQVLLDSINAPSVGILAHSLSAALAFRLAARNSRVTRILTTGSIGVRFPLNEVLARVWTFPPDREAVRALFQDMVYDPSVLTDAFLDDRMAVLSAGDYSAYFSEMFGGDKQGYLDAMVLDATEWRNVRCPVLMVHGKDDKACPWQQTALPIREKLPQADLFLFARCGHGPVQEHPGRFLTIANEFFGQ